MHSQHTQPEGRQSATIRFPAARLAEQTEWTPATDLKLWLFAEYRPTLGDSGRSLLSAEAGIESLVRRWLGLQLRASFRLDSDPARGKEDEDFTFSTTFTFRF